MKKLLLPFSWLYGAAVRLRNILFDTGMFESRSFEQPFTIGVGNLSAGGTGKSPHVAFLAEALSKKYKTAILSRGYRRKTSGFRMATDADTMRNIGDEPVMYQSRFKGTVAVAVCEERVKGVEKLMDELPGLELVILDDVFQHRKIRPQLNILITSYQLPFYKDYLLPAGYLREPSSGKKRADIIIVSKCPDDLSESSKESMRKKVAPDERQLLLFSYYTYSELIPAYRNGPSKLKADIVLITGIADPSPLKRHLSEKYNLVKTFDFSDHHEFSKSEIEKIAEYFNNIAGSEKILLTTEKDLTRLNGPDIKGILKDLPLYIIRVDVRFSEEDKTRLIKTIDTKIHG